MANNPSIASFYTEDSTINYCQRGVWETLQEDMAWSSTGICRLSKAFARCASCVARQKSGTWKLLFGHGIQSWNILEQMTSNDDKFHRDFGKAPVLCTFVDQLAMEMADELFHDFAVYVNKHQQRECYKTLHNCFLKQKQKVG